MIFVLTWIHTFFIKIKKDFKKSFLIFIDEEQLEAGGNIIVITDRSLIKILPKI